MWQKLKALKTGEKVVLGVVCALVLFTVTSYAALEYARMRLGRPMYPVRTHYDFAGEGFRGSELFRRNNCTNCHKAVGNGTNMGLNLDGIGTRHDLDYILRFLHDPEGTYVTRTVDHGAPPKEAAYVARIPEADLHSIAVFLSQLRVDRGAAAAVQPPEESGFIDAMLDLWVPDGWRIQFSDVRDSDKGAPPPGPGDAKAQGGANGTKGGEGEHGGH